MNQNDYDRFSNALGTAWEVFNPGKEISRILVGAYFKALVQYGIEQIEQAIGETIGKGKFFPKPVEIIEHLAGSLPDVAMVQATQVLETIKRHGAYASVVFDDPVTMAVIQRVFGGWEKLCSDLMADQEKWFLKDFEKSYQAFSRQRIEYNGTLPGIIERKNTSEGYDYPPPTAIGEMEKVRRILLTAKRLTDSRKLNEKIEKIGG